LFFAGCARQGSVQSVEGDGAWPEVLRLGYSPAEELLVDREAANLALARYLERKAGIKVELVQTPAYAPAVEALAGGRVDLISLGPLAYVMAAERGVAEPLAVQGDARTGPRTYQSALIARGGSGLNSLADVVAKAGEVRFNYTDPASNSGHLVPKAKLATLALVPERDFARTEYTRSHAVAVLNVALGAADLAGVSATTLQSLLKKGRIDANLITVLWTSAPLPNGPMTVRASLPVSLKRKLREALLSLALSEPELSRKVMAQYRDANSVFVSCDDTLYAVLHELAAQDRVLVQGDKTQQ
jgi:phosphonate transport system substrate-binding protein